MFNTIHASRIQKDLRNHRIKFHIHPKMIVLLKRLQKQRGRNSKHKPMIISILIKKAVFKQQGNCRKMKPY
jgi:hypothetical protein